jgi:hypothetical protein
MVFLVGKVECFGPNHVSDLLVLPFDNCTAEEAHLSGGNVLSGEPVETAS